MLRHNLIFRNWVENDSHVKSIKTILEHEPNIVAPGHGKPFLSNKADLENLKSRLEDQQKYFFAVIADPDCNFGLNPSWVRLYPYQLQAKAGSSAISSCAFAITARIPCTWKPRWFCRRAGRLHRNCWT